MTSTGATKRATWRLDPMATAIAKSIRSLSASWTATRCSARLPMVGMSTTPTKNGVRPNCSMNGSMAPTSCSESTARSAALRPSTPSATGGDQGGPAWASLSLAAAQDLVGVPEPVDEVERVERQQHDRDDDALLDVTGVGGRFRRRSRRTRQA